MAVAAVVTERRKVFMVREAGDETKDFIPEGFTKAEGGSTEDGLVV